MQKEIKHQMTKVRKRSTRWNKKKNDSHWRKWKLNENINRKYINSKCVDRHQYICVFFCINHLFSLRSSYSLPCRFYRKILFLIFHSQNCLMVAFANTFINFVILMCKMRHSSIFGLSCLLACVILRKGGRNRLIALSTTYFLS